MLSNHNEIAGILHQLAAKSSPLARGLSFTVAYFVLAKLGLSFTSVADNITLIWPPSGLALFALLILGRGFWPWIVVASFITNLTTDISVYACIGIALGNALEAIVGVYLLRRFGFNNQLSHVRDVLYLALFAAGLSTMIAATIGVLSLASFSVISWSSFAKAWITWWMGDSLGILAFTPFFISWWFKYPKQINRSVVIEAVALVLGVIIISEFIFGLQSLIFDDSLPLAYMTFPFLIWASMRFGLRGVTSVTLIIGSIILLNIMFQLGLFANQDTVKSIILLWFYSNFLAITSVVLTTVVEERREAERGMRHLAEHDHLTHLPNRRALVDRIGQAIIHAARRHEKFALLFLDLDRFKVVNDSLGHSKGDELLISVSQRLLSCVRKEDTVSRIGGDEFVILLRGIEHVDDIYSISNKIISTMSQPISIGELEIHSSFSIGICLYPNDGDDAEVLLKHADIAMYRAKDAGRANYKFYSADMNDQVEARLSIESDLRHALNNNEFILYYQPQYLVADGLIKGCEALLRWCKKGDICSGPDLFIPILEDTGHIKEVGVWVIEEACRQLAEWNTQGWGDLRMSVNVSSHQLTDHELPEIIAKTLKRYRIKPECLELEITESMLVRQESTVEEVIQSLVKLGVRLAVDDFGTGYSSLSYLYRLSIDTLKVDRSFVEKIPGNANSEAIAKAIIGLAKSLQLTVVAEGIENNAQCKFISDLKCDYVQGFLLSKPVTAEVFTHLLETESSRPNQILESK